VPVSDINILRNSKLVRQVVDTRVDSTGDAYILKARAELVNGWSLHYWEHGTGKVRRYSFQVLLGRTMVVRWDNAPHHPGVRSFPHHKHAGRTIEASKDMTVELVLAELKAMIGKG
jgi:Family of unknown function (DUF6516)